MSPATAELYAGLLMEEHGLLDWDFIWLKSTKVLGRCCYPRKADARRGRIGLSKRYVERNTEEEVVDTILHEIAHALAGPGHGHGVVWRAFAIALGARPLACATDVVSAARYGAKCCDVTYHIHRMPKRRYMCRKCSTILTYERL